MGSPGHQAAPSYCFVGPRSPRNSHRLSLVPVTLPGWSFTLMATHSVVLGPPIAVATLCTALAGALCGASAPVTSLSLHLQDM